MFSVTVRCGASSSENCTYFEGGSSEVGPCSLKICRCDQNVCQVIFQTIVLDMINQERKCLFLSFTVETWLFIFHHNWTFYKYNFCCKNHWRPGKEKSYHYDLCELAVLGKEVCNWGVTCSCLQLGSLEKTVKASLIALWYVLRPPFFVEKMMSHVMFLNDLRRKVMSFFLQKKTNIFLWCQIDS